MTRMLEITGSRAKLAAVARLLGAAVTEHPRTGVPVVRVDVPAACPVYGGHALPDGRMSGYVRDDAAGERATFWCNARAFVATVRGWTSEDAAAALAAESQRRMRAHRTALDTDRRISFA